MNPADPQQQRGNVHPIKARLAAVHAVSKLNAIAVSDLAVKRG
jgi:hypothetical protein